MGRKKAKKKSRKKAKKTPVEQHTVIVDEVTRIAVDPLTGEQRTYQVYQYDDLDLDPEDDLDMENLLESRPALAHTIASEMRLDTDCLRVATMSQTADRGQFIEIREYQKDRNKTVIDKIVATAHDTGSGIEVKVYERSIHLAYHEASLLNELIDMIARHTNLSGASEPLALALRNP